MIQPTEDALREKLLSIVKENGLRLEDLPELTGYSRDTVKAWLMPDRESSRARPVPQRAIDLLTRKLEEAKARLRS